MSDLIPPAALNHERMRLKAHVAALVLLEFARSGETLERVCARLGYQPKVLQRLVKASASLRWDEASDTLFAISGAELRFGLAEREPKQESPNA